MVATIQISPYIQIQGTIARVLPNGQVTIRQGGYEYVGQPLQRPTSDRTASRSKL